MAVKKKSKMTPRSKPSVSPEKAKLQKESQKRLDQILENDLVDVKVTGVPIPLESDHISATAYPGLMDYKIHGTHLRLLGMEDPTQEPTTEQRAAMAKVLVNVGPFLPMYVQHATLKVGKGITPEEAAESVDVMAATLLRRKTVKEAESKRLPGREIVRRVREKGDAKREAREAASAIPNGVPLKRVCANAGVDPKIARRILRSKGKKPSGRWEWKPEDVAGVVELLKTEAAKLAAKS